MMATLVAMCSAHAAHAQESGNTAGARAGELPPLNAVVALARERAVSVVEAQREVAVANAGYAGARLSPLTNPYAEVFADRRLNGTGDVAVQGSVWFPVEV